MLEPTAIVLAEKATRQHVLSAHPKAPTVSAGAARVRSDAMRRLTAVVLRGLADRVEPRRVAASTVH
jgi:hypothetical protein